MNRFDEPRAKFQVANVADFKARGVQFLICFKFKYTTLPLERGDAHAPERTRR